MYGEASTSFSEEKEAKRLLLIWAMGVKKSRLNDKLGRAEWFEKRLLAL